ncbi:MAG: glycerol-3-phosphate acyltransferase [Dehalococcoidales bacterium]|nr:glycerol-3-phosphate acyltransferase [Dehalococcoidales bacterium]
METIQIIKTALGIIIGYLVGAVPFAYVIARARKGVDIRSVGSGNAGALAVWREVGPAWGAATLALDVGKGALAVGLARWLGLDMVWTCASGFSAVCGHSWPVFLGFRGGKGGAATVGVLLVVLPVPTAIALAIAALLIVVTSNVRLGGFIGLATVPLTSWLFHRPMEYVYFSLVLLAFLIIMTFLGIKKELARSKGKISLIVDRDYHFWQTKKGSR